MRVDSIKICGKRHISFGMAIPTDINKAVKTAAVPFFGTVKSDVFVKNGR